MEVNAATIIAALGSILQVATDGATDAGKLRTNLVMTPRLQLNLEKIEPVSA